MSPRLSEVEIPQTNSQEASPNTQPEINATCKIDSSPESGENSALARYLRDISETELLSPEEEVHLARLIKAGDESARECMIKANLRLVVKFARDYDGLGVPILDLISEGNIGLMIAAERYDGRRGARFSTYASFWIKHHMRSALSNQSRIIRLPHAAYARLRRIRAVQQALLEELGREPDCEELAATLGIRESDVAELCRAACHPASLHAPLSEFEAVTLADIVEDESAEDPAGESLQKEASQALHGLIDKLSPRQAAILAARYGLNGADIKTLAQLAQQYGVTVERIRQIEMAACRRLRDLCRPTPPRRPTQRLSPP